MFPPPSWSLFFAAKKETRIINIFHQMYRTFQPTLLLHLFFNEFAQHKSILYCKHTVKSTVRSLTMRLFTCYFRFQNKCNRNKFEGISQWISGFYIKLIYKECHWTPFYQPITLRGREYHFPVVRMFLRAFSPKQWAETSVHKGKHPSVTKNDYCQSLF